jgi:formylglycine-generating enzyme required for sulfatase activity
MVRIEGGEFVIGVLPEEVEQARQDNIEYLIAHGYQESLDWIATLYEDEINQQLVTVGSFEIARFPVTNAQFALFMQDGGYDFHQPWWDEETRNWLFQDKFNNMKWHSEEKEWKQQILELKAPRSWVNTGQNRPNHPVLHISTYEAVAFCHWLTQHREYNPGGYVYLLPSEAEWEYMARGQERRLYPWGSEPPSAERANFNLMEDGKIFGNPYKGTTAVGCFPRGATPSNILDVAGNVWELTSSLYAPYNLRANQQEDTDHESDGPKFVNRGGGWYNYSVMLKTYQRNYLVLGADYDHIGFRLVRYPPDKA